MLIFKKDFPIKYTLPQVQIVSHRKRAKKGLGRSGHNKTSFKY